MTLPRLMLIAAAALAACSQTYAADDTLTIGFTVSRTGKLNNESTAQMRGFELWRDEVNAKGGIAAGASGNVGRIDVVLIFLRLMTGEALLGGIRHQWLVRISALPELEPPA